MVVLHLLRLRPNLALQRMALRTIGLGAILKLGINSRVLPRYQTARAQVEQLTPALLAKAFRGELVPQDPHDEPASRLMERLRAEEKSGE